jgi:predicted DNA-binding transcriptional regulator YafY
MLNDPLIKKARLCKLLNNPSGQSKIFLLNTLGVSDRTFIRYIEDLRIMGAEISYNKYSNTYYLENGFDLLDYCKRELV